VTLSEITRRITEAQRLAEQNPAAAVEQNRALFVDLARQDESYIVPVAPVSDDALASKNFRPYAAQAQEGDPRVFLRVFSHEDAADAFAKKAGSGQYVRLDGVELMQIAKFYFMRGDYGFLLNDGLAWAAISFPDFLRGCFTDILGDATLARQEFIDLVQFINMVRQCDKYQMYYARQIVKDAQDPEKVFFLDQSMRDKFNGAEFVFEPLNIEKLLQLANTRSDAHLHIRTEKARSQVSPDMLRAVFHSTGLGHPLSEDYDFHTDSITLDFSITDFEGTNAAAQHVQLAELPRPQEEIPDSGTVESEKKPFNGKGLLSALKGLFLKRGKKTPDTTTEEESVTSLNGVEPLGQEGEPPKQAEKAEKAPQQEEKAPSCILKILSPKLFIGLFFVVMFAIIATFIISLLLKEPPVEDLQKSIAQSEYTDIASRYNDCVKDDAANKEVLLPLMAQDLQTKLSSYAADELPATDLAEAINAYSKIPAMKEVCGTVYTKAQALEESKIAYQNGLMETSILSRLEAWRSVIADDTGSQAAMKKNLEQNSDVYKTSAFLEGDNMAPKSALSKMFLLQTYYPDDPAVSEKIASLQAEAFAQTQQTVPGAAVQPQTPSVVGFENAPIHINQLTTKTSITTGETDLYISWTNTSGKAIEQIYFTVAPLDAAGNTVATTVDNGDGLYSKFLAAMDTSMGPFENGYTLPDDSYWKDAWTNFSITSARLVEVSISYVGEPVPVTIYEAEDLMALFQTGSEEENPAEAGAESESSLLTPNGLLLTPGTK